MNPTAAQMIEHLARRADKVISDALTARLGTCNWDPHDIARRVRVEVGPDGETFYLDDEPLLWLGKPKATYDEESGAISADREWRMLS